MLLNGEASAAISFVSLSGAWTVDEPLYIPRQVVIALADGASLTAAQELESLPLNKSSVVFADGPSSALVAPGGVDGGARIMCQGFSVRGVFALQASGFNMEGVTVDSCGGVGASYCTGAVHFLGAPFASVGRVARSKIVGGCRGIWLQTFSRLYLYENTILSSTKFGIDFDSFSGPGLVWANTIVGAVQNGIFIEQGAQYVAAIGNNITCGGGNGNAIGVYPFQFVADTKNHNIAANTISACLYGLSIGSTPSSGGNTWTPASAVSFIANSLDSNNIIGIHANGPQTGTVYMDNFDAVGFDASAMLLSGSALAYDPLGRAKVLNVSKSPSRTRSPTASKTPSLTQTPSASASPSVSSSPGGAVPSTTPTESPLASSAPLMPSVCAPFVAAAAAAAVAASASSSGNSPSSKDAIIYAGAGGLLAGILIGALLFRHRLMISSARTRALTSAGREEKKAEHEELVTMSNPAHAAVHVSAPRFRRVTDDELTWFEPEDFDGDPVWVLPSGAVVVS